MRRLLFLQPGTNRFQIEAADKADNPAQPITVMIQYNLPEEDIITESMAYYVSSGLTLDGYLTEADWSIDTLLGKPGLGTPNNIVRFGALWDEVNLYVGIKVKDARLVPHPTTVWQGDSIEVYLSPSDSRVPVYADNDRQLQFGLDWTVVKVGGNKSNAGIEFAQQQQGDGYTMEIKIPWANVDAVAELEKVIGFEVNNIDNDGINSSGDRESVLLWNGTMSNYKSTSMFGKLRLTGRNGPEQ
ncbi:MAG: hypothetical protein K0R57_3823 [Paenibacillaceae bacterium]|nr:hypothetical protein [Paenibacillaceae bacterium]